MDFSRSAGWPWKQWYSNKRAALENPIVFDRVTRGKCWRNPEPVWDVFGKHEILTTEKSSTRCRIITSCPVDVSIVTASWYEQQNDALMGLCYSSPYGVGLTKVRHGWQTTMERFGDTVWQCDVSQYDSCIRPYLVRAVYDVRRALFTDVSTEYLQFEDKWLEFLIDGILRDFRSGDIYNVSGGNKSGSPNTSSDNTIANMIVVNYAQIMVSQDVKFVCYGDDMLLDGSLSSDFFQFYTDAGFVIKPGSVVLTDKKDADFLSCKSKIIDGCYVPIWNPHKAAFSLMTCDSRRELVERQRYQSLLLESLWLDEYPLLDEYVLCKGYNVSRTFLIRIFYGQELLGLVGTKENAEKETFKEKSQDFNGGTVKRVIGKLAVNNDECESRHIPTLATQNPFLWSK